MKNRKERGRPRSKAPSPRPSKPHPSQERAGVEPMTKTNWWDDIRSDPLPYLLCSTVFIMTALWLHSFWEASCVRRQNYMKLSREGVPIEATVRVYRRGKTKHGTPFIHYSYEFVDQRGERQMGVIYPEGRDRSDPTSFSVEDVLIPLHASMKITVYMVPAHPTIHAPFPVEDRHIRRINFMLGIGTVIAFSVAAVLLLWLREWRRRYKVQHIEVNGVFRRVYVRSRDH